MQIDVEGIDVRDLWQWQNNVNHVVDVERNLPDVGAMCEDDVITGLFLARSIVFREFYADGTGARVIFLVQKTNV
jgi:hypothetical protein